MNEAEYRKIYEETKDQNDKGKDYEIKQEILYRIKENQRLQVIRRFELEGIMYMMHDHPTSAHFGINATYEKTKERYYWKNMKKDIEEYVKTCDQCQRRGK